MESITLTAKIKIIPDESEHELLMATMRVYTTACNFVSVHIFETKDMKLRSLHNKLYYEIRGMFSLKSQMIESVIITALAKYKALKTNKGEWRQINFKQPQCDLVWNRDYSLSEKFSINTLKGRSHLEYKNSGKGHFFDKSKWKFGTAKLMTNKGKWFLLIPCTTQINIIDNQAISNVVGVDLGINFLTATYDSDGARGTVSCPTM